MKYHTLNIFFFLLISLANFTFAQTPELDSLKLAAKNAKDDVVRIEVFAHIAEICEEGEIYNYASRTLALSEKLLKEKPEAKEKWLKFKSDAYNNIGYTLQQKGNNPEALNYYAKSVKIKETIDDPAGLAGTLNNIGFVYNEQGNIEEALNYYSRALSVFEKLNDKKSVSISLNNLGSLYEHQGEINKAKEFYIRSSETAKKINDEYEECVPLVNLAALHQKDGDLIKARQLNLRCVNVFKKAESHFALLTCYNNLGEIYRDIYRKGKNKRDIDTAKYYLHAAIAESEISGDKLGAAYALNNLAGLYFEKGKPDSAEVIAKKALSIGQKIGSPESIKRSAGALYAIYRTKNEYRQALEMHELLKQMDDSLSSETIRKSTIRSFMKYEFAKKTAADSVAHLNETQIKNAQIAQQEAEISAKRTSQYFLFGGLALVIVFAGFMYNRFKVTQKQKLIIEEQKAIVESQKNLVEEKQKEILDSINYAKRIQTALMPSEKYIDRKLKEHLFKD